MIPPKLELLVRFQFNYIINKDTGCWEWNKVINSKGYGHLYYKRKIYLVHRISYFLYNGQFDESLDVLHICDNNKCCNPDHLFLGTQDDNNKDKMNKGRCFYPEGMLNSQVKLNPQKVIEIRDKYRTGYYTQKKLANEYNVCRQTISDIMHKSWKHI